MTPAARLSAAIELLDTIDTERVPAAKALKEWGTAHRYAGSGDRAAISGLVWDVLRRRASSAWLMGEDTPQKRAQFIATIPHACSGCSSSSAAWMSMRSPRCVMAVVSRRSL